MATRRPARPDTRTAVLDVAERMVQERGFNAFSYGDVAAELHVTTAALHYHFPGKAELGEALLNRYTKRFGEALVAIDDTGGSPLDRLRAYADLYLDVLRADRMCLCGMLAADYRTLPDGMQRTMLRFFDENYAWLEGVLEEGRANGTLAFSGGSLEAAQMVLGTLEGAMLVARPYGDSTRFEAVADQLLAEIDAPEPRRGVTADAVDQAGPDPVFADPRLAAIYDDLDGDRRDLDAYVSVVREFDARSVLDIGCGTGTLACRLTARDVRVVGVDPAKASLDVARHKPGAEGVTWVEGDVAALPPLEVDLATMTGNVAQVFLTDDDWAVVLRASWRALRPGGRLVFETRDPARQAWLEWNPDRTRRRVELGGSAVETWTDLTAVHWPTVSFRSTFVFDADGTTLVSDSTLRFRDRTEIEASLTAPRFTVEDVRGAPDRPGLEMVFVATKTPS